MNSNIVTRRNCKSALAEYLSLDDHQVKSINNIFLSARVILECLGLDVIEGESDKKFVSRNFNKLYSIKPSRSDRNLMLAVMNERTKQKKSSKSKQVSRNKKSGLLIGKFEQNQINSSARKMRRYSHKDLKKKNYSAFYRSDEWLRVRYLALKNTDGRCCCCGISAKDGAILHVDHIKPRSRYPELELDLDNMQILCQFCNTGKGAWDCTDWR